MNRIQEVYGLNDEVYYSQHVSVLLTIDGERVYLVKSYDEYLELKRQHTVTYKIGSVEPCGELYRFDLQGSDGSRLTIHVSDEDIIHNMRLTESVMEIFNAPAIC